MRRLCDRGALIFAGQSVVRWPSPSESPKLASLLPVRVWDRHFTLRKHTRTAGLFLGGALAAADQRQMRSLGITHILNLVGDGIYDVSERLHHPPVMILCSALSVDT